MIRRSREKNFAEDGCTFDCETAYAVVLDLSDGTVLASFDVPARPADPRQQAALDRLVWLYALRDERGRLLHEPDNHDLTLVLESRETAAALGVALGEVFSGALA